MPTIFKQLQGGRRRHHHEPQQEPQQNISAGRPLSKGRSHRNSKKMGSRNATANTSLARVEARREFLRATTVGSQEEIYTNPESLPSVEMAYNTFQRIYPKFCETWAVDDLRDREYFHLEESQHVCMDYCGFGLFSYHQQVINKAASNFALAYISANLPTHALYGAPEDGTTEFYVRKRVMDFLNINEAEYSMVFTASRGSAFKLLGESYPFHLNPKLLTVYDFESEAVNWMSECAKQKGAKIMSACFKWPSLRIGTAHLKKLLQEKKKRGESSKGLFVFPVQSRMTGAKYSYQWMSQAQQNKWHVLLDASAMGPKDMDSLGLSLFRPDFIVSSFYKVFGTDATGFGCLFIKNTAIRSLHNSSRARAVGMVRIVSLGSYAADETNVMTRGDSGDEEDRGDEDDHFRRGASGAWGGGDLEPNNIRPTSSFSGPYFAGMEEELKPENRLRAFGRRKWRSWRKNSNRTANRDISQHSGPLSGPFSGPGVGAPVSKSNEFSERGLSEGEYGPQLTQSRYFPGRREGPEIDEGDDRHEEDFGEGMDGEEGEMDGEGAAGAPAGHGWELSGTRLNGGTATQDYDMEELEDELLSEEVGHSGPLDGESPWAAQGRLSEIEEEEEASSPDEGFHQSFSGQELDTPPGFHSFAGQAVSPILEEDEEGEHIEESGAGGEDRGGGTRTVFSERDHRDGQAEMIRENEKGKGGIVHPVGMDSVRASTKSGENYVREAEEAAVVHPLGIESGRASSESEEEDEDERRGMMHEESPRASSESDTEFVEALESMKWNSSSDEEEMQHQRIKYADWRSAENHTNPAKRALISGRQPHARGASNEGGEGRVFPREQEGKRNDALGVQDSRGKVAPVFEESQASTGERGQQFHEAKVNFDRNAGSEVSDYQTGSDRELSDYQEVGVWGLVKKFHRLHSGSSEELEDSNYATAQRAAEIGAGGAGAGAGAGAAMTKANAGISKRPRAVIAPVDSWSDAPRNSVGENSQSKGLGGSLAGSSSSTAEKSKTSGPLPAGGDGQFLSSRSADKTAALREEEGQGTFIPSQRRLAGVAEESDQTDSSGDELKVDLESPNLWPEDEELPQLPATATPGRSSGHSSDGEKPVSTLPFANESATVEKQPAVSDFSERGRGPPYSSQYASLPPSSTTRTAGTENRRARWSPFRNGSLAAVGQEGAVSTATGRNSRGLEDTGSAADPAAAVGIEGERTSDSGGENYVTIHPTRAGERRKWDNSIREAMIDPTRAGERRKWNNSIPETVSEAASSEAQNLSDPEISPTATQAIQKEEEQQQQEEHQHEDEQLMYVPRKYGASSPPNVLRLDEQPGREVRSFRGLRSPAFESDGGRSGASTPLHPMATPPSRYNSYSYRPGRGVAGLDGFSEGANLHDARDQSHRNGRSDLRSDRPLSRDVDFEDDQFSARSSNASELLASRRLNTLEEDFTSFDMQNSDGEYYSGPLQGSETSRYDVNNDMASASYENGDDIYSDENDDDDDQFEGTPDGELWEGQVDPVISCKGLDFADSLGLTKLNHRLRYLVNWLVNSLLKLRHPGPGQGGTPLVRVYGPKVKYDRGAAVAFNLFDWKGLLIQPSIVQKLADRSNISLGVGRLCNIVDPEMFPDFLAEKERALGEDEVDPGFVDSLPRYTGKLDNGKDPLRIPVVTAAMGFITTFEDVFRLWSFLAKFLDADFVSKEVWRYHSLNQQTIVM